MSWADLSCAAESRDDGPLELQVRDGSPGLAEGLGAGQSFCKATCIGHRHAENTCKMPAVLC